MLARFRILLPYSFSIPQGDSLAPIELDHGGYRIRLYPPYQASTTIAAMADPTVIPSDLVNLLHPPEQPNVDQTVIVNGQPTIRANAIQIDVLKSEFDRTASINGRSSDDPPINMLIELTQSMLHRLRSVGRGHPIHPIAKEGNLWRLEFLTDAGEKLPEEKGKLKARASSHLQLEVAGLTHSIWNAAMGLPLAFRTQDWETLLLDAESHLPDEIPAITLAAAALETLIGYSLSVLAPTTGISGELWNFIIDRGRRDYRNEIGVKEKYDEMLHALTGHSLKEMPRLWEAFMNIKDIRNSLMHKGIFALGDKPVTRAQAYDLIERAKELADWIEGLLQESARRPPICPTAIGIQRMMIMNRTSGEFIVSPVSIHPKPK
jgi:hypothetical protein